MPRTTIPMTLTPDSSTIAGYGYDAASGTMVIQFKSSQGSKEYEYPSTPPERFAEFDAAPSKGSWWHKNRTSFPNFRIMEEDRPVDSEGGTPD